MLWGKKTRRLSPRPLTVTGSRPGCSPRLDDCGPATSRGTEPPPIRELKPVGFANSSGRLQSPTESGALSAFYLEISSAFVTSWSRMHFRGGGRGGRGGWGGGGGGGLGGGGGGGGARADPAPPPTPPPRPPPPQKP